MIIDLKGRKAIVTGSTAGIGRATAEGLARAGAAVVVNGRGTARVDEAVRQIRQAVPGSDVSGVAADMATPEGVEALVAQVPEADILVNNVGTAYLRPYSGIEDIAKIPDEDWLSLFQLNVMSGVRASRHYLPGMVRRGWGRVVFVSSESAVNIPKEMLDYGMTKTAQLAVSRGLAEAVAGTGVTVNAVLPGPTRSEILGNFMAQQAEGPGHHAGRGRAGVPEGGPADQPSRAVRDDRRSRQHDRLRLLGAGLRDQRGGAARRRRRGPIRGVTACRAGDGGRRWMAATDIERRRRCCVASRPVRPTRKSGTWARTGSPQHDPCIADGVAGHLTEQATKAERPGREESN